MTRIDHERKNRQDRADKARREVAFIRATQPKHRSGKNPKKQNNELLRNENNRLRKDYAELQQKHKELQQKHKELQQKHKEPATDGIKRRITEVNDRLRAVERDTKTIRKFIMALVGRSRVAASTSSTESPRAR